MLVDHVGDCYVGSESGCTCEGGLVIVDSEWGRNDCGSDGVIEWCSCGGESGCGFGEWVDGVCAGCGEDGKLSKDGWDRLVCFDCGCCNY